MVKKKVKKNTRRSKPKAKGPVSVSLSKRMRIAGRRLIFFLSFFVVFLVLDVVIADNLWSDFFGIGFFIFGFISVALLLVYLILWFMKGMKKK